MLSRVRIARGRFPPSRFFSSSSTKYDDFTALAVARPMKHVVQVELNRPDKANAMNEAFFTDVGRCFSRIAGDKECRAVVLSGAGKNFTAGLDLQEFASVLGLAPPGSGGPGGAERPDVARKAFSNMALVERLQNCFSALHRCPKPVIAAIHAACVGGGVDLICGADVRFCSADAWFSVKEVDIGIAADLGTLQRLPRIVGSDSLVRELVYSARKLPAAEAKDCGLVSRVLEDRASLLEAALALAGEVAAKSPVAVQGSKINLNYAQDHGPGDALEYQRLWNAIMLQTSDLPTAVGTAMTGKPATFPEL